MSLLSSVGKRSYLGRVVGRGRGRSGGRVVAEGLDGRVLLSGMTPSVELFDASAAVFVENQGQWADEGVRYAFDGAGCAIGFRDEGLDFRLSGGEQEGAGAGFSLRFEGANRVRPGGEDRAETVFNYFVGEQSNWRSNVAGYGAVAYEGLYAGVDLRMSGQRSSMKYEFHVAPGGDYQQIQLRYEGIGGLAVGADGSLVVDLGEGRGQLVDDAPVIYQEIDGRRVEVAGRFVVLGSDAYGFEISGEYDRTRELVIDPTLAWSTYLGGSSDEAGEGIAVDGSGNVLVTGRTSSSGWTSLGFDTSYNGSTGDAFVAKLSPSGAHLWSSYLGGNMPDDGSGVAVDGLGNVLVTGSTRSSGWTSGGFDTSLDGGGDAFVAKLSPAGGHLWSTYVGGSGPDYGYGIAVDGSGNVLVTGDTASSGWTSAGFDTSINGEDDAFVAKLSPSGAYLWSSYLGGSSYDVGYGVAADGSGNVLVTGYTFSPGWTSGGFDTSHNGSRDAFAAKLSPTGGHLWSTYLGGSGQDYGYGIAVDGLGNVLVSGETQSAGWARGGYDTSYNGGSEWGGDAFVAKLSSTGAHLWSTYLGGSGDERGYDIAVDGSGNVLLAGETFSTGWISGGFDTSFGGIMDVFVAKLSPAGMRLWSTYMGGSTGDYGYGIAVDGLGNVLVTGMTGSTGWISGGFDTSLSGSWDGFVAKISGLGDPVKAIVAMGEMVVTIWGSRELDSVKIGDQGRVEVVAGGDKLIETDSLEITDAGVLDLADNDLIIHATAETRGDVLGQVCAWIKSGRAGGTWSGKGIVSSVGRTGRFTGLAAVVNEKLYGGPILPSLGGEALSINDIIVKYTYDGDMNVDGVVNADDYFLIDTGFIGGGRRYQDGDLNYDGVINADDYFLIDGAFLGQGGPLGVGEDAVVMRVKGMVGVFAAGKVKRVWEELSEGV